MTYIKFSTEYKTKLRKGLDTSLEKSDNAGRASAQPDSLLAACGLAVVGFAGLTGTAGSAFGGSLLCLFPLDGFVDFLTVNRYLPGGVYPQAHLIATDIDNCNLDIVADYDRLFLLSAKDQHFRLLCLLAGQRRSIPESLRHWPIYSTKFYTNYRLAGVQIIFIRP